MSIAGGRVRILTGDCRDTLATLPAGSVNCVVTSPPYFGLRDYGMPDQIGLEPTPAEFVAALVTVFRELRRVLRDDGTAWLNLGDSYAGGGGVGQPHRDSSGGIGNKGTRGQQGYHASGGGFDRPCTVGGGIKQKDLIGIPWRVAFALQDDGWYLRQDIIWAKPSPMPESVRDRCTKAHEYVFLLTKSPRYWFDQAAITEAADPHSIAHGKKYGSVPSVAPKNAEGPTASLRNGAATHCGVGSGRETRNRRSVWTIASQPYDGAHFATMPPSLAEPCILAGCPKGGTVLDPFGGAGTTGLVAARHGRNAILCELNPTYAALARDRIAAEWREPVAVAATDLGPLFGGIA